MTDYPTDPAAYCVVIERSADGPVTAIKVCIIASGEVLTIYAGDEAVGDLIRMARDFERGEPGTDKLPSDRALIEAALMECCLWDDDAEGEAVAELDRAAQVACLPREALIPKDAQAIADLAAALRGLLECAELNQDDLEGDTRYLIDNAEAILARVEG